MPRVCWVAPCRQYARVARHNPAINRHVGSLFGQHLRWWPTIIPTYIQRLQDSGNNEPFLALMNACHHHIITFATFRDAAYSTVS